MIYTILTSILLITIHSQPSSFNNLPDTSLTSYQDTTSCNSLISGVFLPHTNYQYHRYKLSKFNGIGCTIFANLTATNSNINSASSLSILIYTSSGKLYNTTSISSISFTNKHDSTYYIVFYNSNPNSHYATLYEYTLQCTKKCHRKIPQKIRRMQSGTETDDDYDDINGNGIPVGVESGDDDESEQPEESQSNEEPEEFISIHSVSDDNGESDDSSEGAETVADMDIITTTTSAAQIEATTTAGNKNENQRIDSSVDGQYIGDSILNNGKNKNAEIRTYDIMIDFSKTAIENVWAAFLVIVAFICTVAYCSYNYGQKKVKYVDELPSISSNNNQLP